MNWLENIELDEIEAITATEETTEERNERFKITDLASMNWALRKLSALESNHDEEANLANAELNRINTWYSKQEATYQGSKQFLEGLVKAFAKEQHVIDPKARFKTPYGAVSFRKQQPKFDYGNEENLVNYLIQNEFTGLYKTVSTPIKAELKIMFPIVEGKMVNADTGEIIPEITVTEREELVTIKLEG